MLISEVVAEQRVVARLQQEGATTAARALRLPDLSAAEALGLEELLRAGIVREAAPGSYYVAREGLRPRRVLKRVFFGLLFALLVALTLALAVLGVVTGL